MGFSLFRIKKIVACHASVSFKIGIVAHRGELASILGAVEKRGAIKDLIVLIFMTILYLYKFAIEIICDKIQSVVRNN